MRRALALAAALALVPLAAAAAPLFVDATPGSGIPPLRFGEGVNAVDVTGDGLPDLFLPVVRGRDRLYRNLGGLRFEDATDAMGISGRGGIGAVVADLDADGRPEIAVVRGAWPAGGVTLLSQGAGGRFSDVSSTALPPTRRNGIAAAVADVDADGLPDLLVTGWGGDLLYRNLGGGRLAFAETAAAAGLGAGGRSWGAGFSDLTGDGRPDLVVARGAKGNGETSRLFVNLGGMRFEDRTGGTDLGSGGWSMGSVSLDCDADGDFDLLVTGYEGPDRLYRNDGHGSLRDATPGSGISSRRGVGAAAGFVDGDLLPDLVVASFDGPVRFYRNLGDCRFADDTRSAGLQAHPRNEGVVLADFDGDGDLDLYVTNFDGANRLYRNSLDDPSFIKVRFAGGGVPFGTVVRVVAVDDPGAPPLPAAAVEMTSAFGYCSQGPPEALVRVPAGRRFLVSAGSAGRPAITVGPRAAGVVEVPSSNDGRP